MLTLALTSAADDTARTAGAVFGRLLILGIFAAMLIIGLRRRRATNGQKGTVLTVVGGLMLTLAVLGTLASLATASG
ncbi:MAG TPA: hypothetical protein VE547_13585 [Mycobacteriales bacterium]|nr:hypothetical protein [Mycobacteriales bacterium]